MPVFSGGRRIPVHPVRPSLRDPRFALLLVGQSAGWVCSWAASLVLWGFAAYHFGASPAGISLTALCWSGPPVVLTAFTGGLTDRFGPRTMLIIGYTCSAATSLGMSVSGSLTSLDIMALACGAARSLCSPASSALPTRIVEPDDLLAANSLLGVTASIGQVAGPLAASVLMAATGFRIAFTADATMYLVGALGAHPASGSPAAGGAAECRGNGDQASSVRAVVVPRRHGEAHGPGSSPGAGTTLYRAGPDGGHLHVWRVPGHRAALPTLHVLHQPSSQFTALFEAATGIGAVVTGLLLPAIRRRVPGTRSPMWLLTAGAVSCGLAAALFTGTPWVLVAYLGAFVWGVCGTVFYAVAATTLQRLAPAGKLGRVSGVISTAESTTESLSMPVAGALVAVAGLRPGALLLAAVAVAAGAVRLDVRHHGST